MPDAILVHCSGTIVFVNPALLNLLGATSLDQVVGRQLFDFVHQDSVSAVEERIRRFPTLVGQDSPLEHRMLAVDGTPRDVEGLAVPITWEGEPAIEVVIRDISERRRAQHSVEEWNKRHELTNQSGLKIGLWRWDINTNLVEWSDEMYRQFGFSRESFSGRVEDATARIHPDDVARVQEAMEKSVSDSSDFAAQYRIVRPDGTIRWIESRGSIVQNGTKRMTGVGIDITEIKEKEESLLESQQSYLRLLNSTAEGIYGLDLNGYCTFCNIAAARMLGYESPEQMIGKAVHKEHHAHRPDGSTYPVEECLIYQGFRRGAGTHSDDELFWRVDGSSFPIEYWSHPTERDGKIIGGVVTFLDTSARRKAEEALRSSERYYRLMFDQNPHPMWVYDERSLKFLAVNQAAIDHYGYSREEFQSMTLLDIRPKEDVAKLLGRVREDAHSYATDAGTWRHQTKDGKIIYVEILCRQLSFENQSASLVLANDVSDRLRAEEALVASEEKYREFLENVSFGIYRSAPDGTLLDVNPALVSMLGYVSKAELMKQNLNADIYERPEDRKAILIQSGPDRRVAGTTTTFRKKDGAIITVRLDGKEIHKDGHVSHYEVIVEDITERRLLEDQLRQAQKMEAIGRLAGGVAHDFNNALGVITGYSELLQFKLTHDDALHKHAGEILKAGMKAASLTHQLLAFSRKQNLRPQVVNLNCIVQDIDKMLRRLIGENIDLINVSAPDLAMVMADPSQVEQVLMNLVVNARDAMPHGGKVRIETTNTEVRESLTRRHKYLAPGKYVVLSVTDSGCGMDEKVMSQIFEPFFTTKGPGKGTGLGLSTVYGIVKQSGGYITVDSMPNRGTRFSIYLPPTNQIAGTTAASDIAPSIPLGSETVLLVEDEAALRELASSTLSGGGYTVLSAGSAESGLAIAQRHEGRIHLVLTDVILPGISGPDLVESLRISFPEVKAIFMSGYTDELLGQHGMLGPEIVLLQKPFSTKTLLLKMREVLDT